MKQHRYAASDRLRMRQQVSQLLVHLRLKGDSGRLRLLQTALARCQSNYNGGVVLRFAAGMFSAMLLEDCFPTSE